MHNNSKKERPQQEHSLHSHTITFRPPRQIKARSDSSRPSSRLSPSRPSSSREASRSSNWRDEFPRVLRWVFAQGFWLRPSLPPSPQNPFYAWWEYQTDPHTVARLLRYKGHDWSPHTARDFLRQLPMMLQYIHRGQIPQPTPEWMNEPRACPDEWANEPLPHCFDVFNDGQRVMAPYDRAYGVAALPRDLPDAMTLPAITSGWPLYDPWPDDAWAAVDWQWEWAPLDRPFTWVQECPEWHRWFAHRSLAFLGMGRTGSIPTTPHADRVVNHYLQSYTPQGAAVQQAQWIWWVVDRATQSWLQEVR